VQRLPRALIGLDSPTCGYFAAIGTKIMVTHGSWPDRAVPVFDVRTRGGSASARRPGSVLVRGILPTCPSATSSLP
jgi:hypothetical protein